MTQGRCLNPLLSGSVFLTDILPEWWDDGCWRLNPLLSGSVFLTPWPPEEDEEECPSLNPLLSGSVFLTMKKVVLVAAKKCLNPLLSGSVFLTIAFIRHQCQYLNGDVSIPSLAGQFF